MSRTVAAALILHAVQLLDQMGFKDHAQLGVLINADEEQGSPASGAFGAHANDNE